MDTSGPQKQPLTEWAGGAWFILHPPPPPPPPVRQLRSFFSLYYLNEQIKDLGDHSVSLRLSGHSLVHSIHSLDMPGMAWRDGGDLVAEPPTTGATRFWQVD